MRAGAKYAVIYRHRNEYPVSVMCRFFQVSRNGYYDFVRRLGRPETDISYIHAKQGVLYLSMIRKQHRCLQDWHRADSQPGTGHHSPGYTQREKEGRRGVAAPQRPRFSIHLSSILQPNPILRHKAFHVKESLMTTRWQKISFRFSKQSASTGISRSHSKKPTI